MNLFTLKSIALICTLITPFSCPLAQSSLPQNFAPNLPISPTNSQSCWKEAADYHHVDMWLLYSMAWVESRHHSNSIGKNKNGSLDLGLMQINTLWLPTLAKHGISAQQLFDPCTSMYVGAWILAKNIRTYGYTWRAIGAYNSSDLAKGMRYAQKVYQVHARFTGVPIQYVLNR